MTMNSPSPVSLPESSASSLPSKPSATFVLVHGAWHGGWCWRRVADLLRAARHVVYTPTLTGLGDRSHLFSSTVGLHTHVHDIVNLIEWEGLNDVVLCGHSYGGTVITGVAEAAEKRLAAMVYLDAFIPAAGQSLLDIASPESQVRLRAALAQGAGLAPIPAAAFGVNEADRAWVDARCTPQPGATFTDALPAVGAYERVAAKHYVRALDYASTPFDGFAAAHDARADWVVTRLRGGHDLMLDSPRELADVLLRAAGR
jgi:pimeloyl-ACP methyl ester carboxylesterase